MRSAEDAVGTAKTFPVSKILEVALKFKFQLINIDRVCSMGLLKGPSGITLGFFGILSSKSLPKIVQY